MDRKLHLLDSFSARGSDGKNYKVLGYEHLAKDQSLADGLDRWEPTGLSEYRLGDGRRVEIRSDGAMLIAGTQVRLSKAVTTTA